MTPQLSTERTSSMSDSITHGDRERKAKKRLQSSSSERCRRSAGRDPFGGTHQPPELVLNRHYTDFALPLRYSHHNQYDNHDLAASGRGDGNGNSKPFMQLFSSRMIRLKLMQNQRRQTMPFMSNLW